MPELYVKREIQPRTVTAVRYDFGKPLDDIRRVAYLGSRAAEIVEVPEWRLLLVRTGPPSHDPFYEVVADGTWLVYDQETGNLAAWDDNEFGDEFQPIDSTNTAATQPDAELITKAIATSLEELSLTLSADQLTIVQVATARHLRSVAG